LTATAAERTNATTNNPVNNHRFIFELL
jgi:hypothetical protein